MNTNQENTTDYRILLLNKLLQTPHRDLAKIYPTHKEVIDQDPLFYVHLAAWYNDKGEIRDNKEMFIINLLTHSDNLFREVGLSLLHELPPYEIIRVVDFIHGKYDKKLKMVTGLKKNIPGSMRTEIERYLHEREADVDWFDSSVLTARKHLKRLYALLHIAPSERAQAVLFEDKPPEGSRLADLKELVKLEDPAAQAELIINRKIPYRIASTVVKNMTPTVLLALIEVMTPQELINNMGSLRKRGVFDNPDLKSLVEDKLKKAEGSKKVSSLKAMEAAKVAGLSEDLNEALQNVSDKQVKNKGRISRATALLIDKSLSMGIAIELGKQMASLISAVMAEGVPLYVYATDVMAYPIQSKGNALAEWNEAMKYIKAGNGTCLGAPLVVMKNNKQIVEQIVMITDEGENAPPAFLKSYEDYCTTLNIRPSVHMIRCGTFCNVVSDKLERAGVEISKYDIKGGKGETDYYSLPGIISYLMHPGKLEILMEIMNYPLPQRKSIKEKKEVLL
jgi:hypothetical protein